MSRVLPPVPWFLFLLAVCAPWFSAPLAAATSLTQFGITWHFDGDVTAGRFANGDHWVVGPVTITKITPATTEIDGATLHGSMVNPAINGRQGYDSRIRNNAYDASLNVALNLPLTLPAGSSLLTAESLLAKSNNDDPQLKTIAILTVLEKAPPAGAFRPPPVGTDKTPVWRKSDMNTASLRSLPRVADTPSLATVEGWFERPWIEQKLDWTGRYMHPRDNQPAYGRDLASRLAMGLLTLQLDYTPAEKEKLLIRLVQYGIDVYGAARLGGRWNADGGHNMGRKMPLLLAATVLDDKEMLAYADARRHFIFQEDQQTWYVTEADVGRALHTGDGRPRELYLPEDVGLPEWGEKHVQMPERDGRNWGVSYRTVAGGAMIGHVLTARLMGLESAWNWPALFDYCDRYWEREYGNGSTANGIPGFVRAAWSIDRPPAAVGAAKAAREAAAAGLTAADAHGPTRLVNVSSRARASTGENVMIAGFVVHGTGAQRVLIRAIGTGLEKHGVSGALPRPRLTLYRDGRLLYQSNWSGAANRDSPTAALASSLGAAPFSLETNDAAFAATLEPGSYTAHITNEKSASGVALLEVYDAGSAGSSTRLSNLSTRAHVGDGANILILGIAIRGDRPKRILVRAIGPTLAEFGIKKALADPELAIYRDQTVVGSNNDWQGAPEIEAAAAQSGALPLPPASRDSALIIELEPGLYTAQVTGQGGSQGVALVEIYEL